MSESPTLPPEPPRSESRPTLPVDGDADSQTTLAPAAAPAAADGRAPPGYEVLGELGRGGMGVVYQARQVALKRLCALKIILAGGHADAAELARFRREAEALARLQHPNIVQVFEVGAHEGRPYFSLEYCPGGSLDRQLNGTPLDPSAAARLVAILVAAVQAAHAAGVVHRDLKPANVLVGQAFQPDSSDVRLESLTYKLTDFGLAKRLGEQGQTQTGSVLGTPSYMAPEQAGGSKDVGPAADVYALGAVLYECLTGRPPFKAATPLDTIMQVVSEEPVPPRQLNAGLPRDLETICLKCLRKEPHRRYASARHLADDLGRFLAGEPVHARPVGQLERATKWCRRRPATAGLLAAIVLLTVASLGVISWLYRDAVHQKAVAEGEAELAREAESAAERDRDKARRAEDKALGQEKLAKSERDRAKQEKARAEQQQGLAEVRLYANQVQAAQREWDAGDVGQAWQSLNSTRPDLRGFEYRYLVTRFHQNQVTLRGHTGDVSGVAVSPDGRRTAAENFALLGGLGRTEAADVLRTRLLMVGLDDETASGCERYYRQAAAGRRDAGLLFRHGAALYRLGRYAEAAAALAESVKVQGGDGFVETWIFQALAARRLGRHDEAARQLERFQRWHDAHRFETWQQRAICGNLLAEARRLIDAPPPMPAAD